MEHCRNGFGLTNETIIGEMKQAIGNKSFQSEKWGEKAGNKELIEWKPNLMKLAEEWTE